MRRSHWIHALAALSGFVVANTASAGRPWWVTDFAGVGQGWRWGPWISGFGERLGYKAPVDPVERFLLYSGKNKNLGYGYKPYLRALWAPFRWEATTGLPFADRVEDVGTGTFGVELVTPDSTVAALDVSRNATGLTVQAVGAFQSVGSRDFSGATGVDLAIEHDGTAFHFFARAEGDVAYVEIGQLAHTQTEAVYPALSAYGIKGKAAVGFDRFRVASSAEAPGTGATHDGLERVYDAFDSQLDVLHRLDGPQTETAVLRAAVAASSEALTQAVTLLTKAARTKAKTAKAKTAAALKAIDKGKPTEHVVKPLRSALDLELAAAKAVLKP